ncbi:S1C family serine protease [Rubritalea marina]|uniref:S1C family serine protease n=1 Tax=Rubritalea marina TaxID=361055 RepID=UPI00035EB3D5|nr:trypsin-like peptidase domain-containing protein [Rubritalea marina]
MRFSATIAAICTFALTAATIPSALAAPAATASAENAEIYKSIVKIEVASQVPDYTTPWNAGHFSGGSGTGFIIGKNQFLTNAHVVSNERRVLITMHGSARKHQARVVHIAHDCDLALLEVDDFSPFEGLPHFRIGDIPKLEDEVRVIGYPVGGERISVTRGIVSRIDFRSYAHSRADMHLVVQIDAAINPGNSGGPVLQNGKVVGVAFQGLTQADNTGYMIPPPVINRFLTDIKDGSYDHYAELGVSEFPLFNPAMRKIYNLAPNDPGVLVADVSVGSSAATTVKQGDILIAIDGHEVDSSGNILMDGERVNMNEIVERKFAGDAVSLKFVRNGEVMEKSVVLKTFPPAQMYAAQYGKKPRFLVQGGLVFQPLNLNLYLSHKLNNPRVRKIFNTYLKDGFYEKHQDVLILTRLLDDPINASLGGFAGNAVETINGQKITTIEQASQLLNSANPPKFLEITFSGVDRPLVIPTKDLAEANQRIRENYGIHSQQNLEN